MAKTTNKVVKKRRFPPAKTPEERENQLISEAIDLAEQQLLDGTASAQVITHFLKLATTKAQLETEKMRHETKLIEAKTESIQSGQRIEELYTEAIEAMKMYGGMGSSVYEESEDL